MRKPFVISLLLTCLLPVACAFDSEGASVDAGPGESPDATPGESPDAAPENPGDLSYPIVDTNQSTCYDTHGVTVACAGSGQDGAYSGHQPSYTDNGDGTVTDNVTQLMWQQGMDAKMNFYDGADYCGTLTVGGYDDWRIPTIKELYSLIDFSGATGTAAPESQEVPADAIPYIDTDYFDFEYGDGDAGERYIDAQWFSDTVYVSTVMGGQECAFGVNHADGRIKCYPTQDHPGGGGFRFRCVRGISSYGSNDFEDNGDDTITDHATGLTWMKKDSAALSAGDIGDGTMDWPDAISFCEELSYGGRDDWRLPNAKELQSLVDYARSPDTTSSAAIDPLFETGAITDEMGQTDYAFYWASTSHLDGPSAGDAATYVSFGRAIGQMQGTTMDVHGAGAQRSDPKTGDRADYPLLGMGPQGDARRVFNMVRCVR